MSVNSAMTAIADKIRTLLGISGTMGLDSMATNLGTVHTNLNSAFTAIGNKGGTVPSSKVSGNLASAINSIPLGVTVQRKTGRFTTNQSGVATVNCGFQPDLFIVIFDSYYDAGLGRNTTPVICMTFAEITETQASATVYVENGIAACLATKTSTGVSIDAIYEYSWDWVYMEYPQKTFQYTAIKYT